VSTTHPYNSFCTVGLYQGKKAQLDGGGADQGNLLEIHTQERGRIERPEKTFITSLLILFPARFWMFATFSSHVGVSLVFCEPLRVCARVCICARVYVRAPIWCI
jgi:hypothetical protein